MPQPTAPASALSIRHRATDELEFIRRTMERASAFTAVPGKGLVANGLVALVGAFLAERAQDDHDWFAIWVGCAIVGLVVGVTSLTLKSRRAGISLLSGPGRRFLVALIPPFAAAAVLTRALWESGDFELMPGCWILLYGVGVLTGGAFAIRPVVVMGGCFFALGVATTILPAQFGNECMAAGFGLLQVAFGVLIARRHGG